MIALWYAEAGKYHVLPLDSRGTQRFADERPQITKARKTYVYYPGTQAVPGNVAANTLDRPFSVSARIATKNGAEGVILSRGGSTGGYVRFIKDRKLHFVHNYVGAEEFHVESTVEVPDGEVEVRFEFEPTGEPDFSKGKGTPGRAQLYIDGKLAGQAELPTTVPLKISLGEGLTAGRDAGSAVSSRYRAPFEFTGDLRQVTVDVSGTLIDDLPAGREAQAKAAMANADASLRGRQPWKAAYDRDVGWLSGAITRHYQGDDRDVKALMGGTLQAFRGWTVPLLRQGAGRLCESRCRPEPRDGR